MSDVLSWKDSAINKRLFQLTSGDLFDLLQWKLTYHYRIGKESVHPNLAKIYSDHLNKFKFNELEAELQYNSTYPLGMW